MFLVVHDKNYIPKYFVVKGIQFHESFLLKILYPNNNIDKLDKRVKDYFNVLEDEFPEWLNEYINTEALLKQQYISVTCGTIYSNLFESNFFYSRI